MSIYIIAFCLFIVFVVLMAVGVMCNRRPISGSCGGLNVTRQNKDGHCITCGAKVDEKLQEKLQKKLVM